MEDLSKILPLYLGQKVYIFSIETVSNGWLKKALENNPDLGYTIVITMDNLSQIIRDGYLPVLRSLSSMTEYEVCSIFREKFAPNFAKRQINRLSESSYSYHQLLSEYGDENTEIKLREMGFDLYRLKEKGLALYPEDINSQSNGF